MKHHEVVTNRMIDLLLQLQNQIDNDSVVDVMARCIERDDKAICAAKKFAGLWRGGKPVEAKAALFEYLNEAYPPKQPWKPWWQR